MQFLYSLARIFCTLCCIFALAGCDVFFLRKMSVERPHNISDVRAYEETKSALLGSLNGFANINGMLCQAEQRLILYCKKPPRTLVAFEDSSGITICLFGIGMSWEKEKFDFLAKALEESLLSTTPKLDLIISRPNEMPECLVPQAGRTR